MKRDEETDMNASRSNDSPDVRPTRVAPWTAVWGVVLAVAVPVTGTGLLVWKQQGEDQKSTALQLQFMNQTQSKMEAKIDVLVDQIQTKAEKDAKQDQQILDLDRRVTRQESR